MEKNYCFVSPSDSSYSTPPNNCVPVDCSSGKISSPNCKCAHPYTVTLVFLYVGFSDLGNSTYYTALKTSLMQSFRSYNLAVDSVTLSSPILDLFDNLHLILEVFPSGLDRFNKTAASALASVLSNQTILRPKYFGPFSVVLNYAHLGGKSGSHIELRNITCTSCLKKFAMLNSINLSINH